MPIAIFDLDGTITHRDTLFPLVLRQLARRPLAAAAVAGVLPAALRFLVDRDRGALKQSCCAPRCAARRAPSSTRVSREFVRDTIARALLSRGAGRPSAAIAMPATTWC